MSEQLRTTLKVDGGFERKLIQLREHSALLPRGKMFRVSNLDRSIVYQPEAMAVVTPIVPQADELLKEIIVANGRAYRTSSRFASVPEAEVRR
jgi:hypothetical protein